MRAARTTTNPVEQALGDVEQLAGDAKAQLEQDARAAQAGIEQAVGEAKAMLLGPLEQIGKATTGLGQLIGGSVSPDTQIGPRLDEARAHLDPGPLMAAQAELENVLGMLESLSQGARDILGEILGRLS